MIGISSSLKKDYRDVNNLCGCAMSQKLPDEETSQFNKDFIKICSKDSDIEYFLEVVVQYPEKLHELHIMIHPFCLNG